MLSAALAYNAVSIELSTVTNGTTTLTTGGSFDTSGIIVGMLITGTGIPSTTYVSSIESATSLTVSSSDQIIVVQLDLERGKYSSNP